MDNFVCGIRQGISCDINRFDVNVIIEMVSNCVLSDVVGRVRYYLLNIDDDSFEVIIKKSVYSIVLQKEIVLVGMYKFKN